MDPAERWKRLLSEESEKEAMDLSNDVREGLIEAVGKHGGATNIDLIFAVGVAFSQIVATAPESMDDDVILPWLRGAIRVARRSNAEVFEEILRRRGHS